MNNINEIISYFSSGSYENDKTNNAINYLKDNNLKIDLDKDKFNKLSNEQKKIIYMYINSSKRYRFCQNGIYYRCVIV